MAHRLPGLDLRSAEGKKYTSIYREVASEFPAGTAVSRLREIAGLKFALEQIQADVIHRGSSSAREDLVRVSNLISRREQELHTKTSAAAASSDASHNLGSVLAKYRAAE
jgi:hypothetical protein